MLVFEQLFTFLKVRCSIVIYNCNMFIVQATGYIKTKEPSVVSVTGVTTINIMTLSLMTITAYAQYIYAECCNEIQYAE
jgi:hypothetical protein